MNKPRSRRRGSKPKPRAARAVLRPQHRTPAELGLLIFECGATTMDDLERKAGHRILALDATNNLQQAVGFEDKWKGLVENSIFDLIEEGYRRGVQYPPVGNRTAVPRDQREPEPTLSPGKVEG